MHDPSDAVNVADAERWLPFAGGPSFVIARPARLQEAPRMFEAFKQEQDDCMKVVLQP